MAHAKATSGKNAKARVNSTGVLEIVSYEMNVTGDEIDDTGTESAGYQSSIPGTTRAIWTVNAFWNLAANQYITPLFITWGTELTSCKQYLNDTTGKFWDLGTVIITDVRESTEVKGGIKLAFTAKTQAAFTPPA